MLKAADRDEPEIHSSRDSVDDEANVILQRNKSASETVDDDPVSKSKMAKLGPTWCGFTVASLVGATVLFTANFLTFMLLVVVGNVLRTLDQLLGTTVENNGDDDKKTLFKSEENRELVLFVLAIVAQTAVNLVTLYFFFCKRTDETRRILSAGVAVFGCCNQRRETPHVVIVPYAEILVVLWKNCCSIISEFWRVFVKFCILPMIMGLLLFLILYDPDSWPHAGTLVLVLLPVVLWLLVWKLSRSQGGFFNQQEYLQSISEADTTILETNGEARKTQVQVELASSSAIELE